MGLITNYIKSFFTKARYSKGVSLFAFWDDASQISSKIYLEIGRASCRERV